MSDARTQLERGRLQLIGGFGLDAAGGAQVVLTNRRARGLLAYLYLGRDRAAGRERLCGLLWSDRGEAQARASLRQCVFHLRGQLADAGIDMLGIARDRISLRGDCLTSDVAELRDALGGDDTNRLVGVLGRLSRAKLLEDLELPGLFQDWLVQTRSEFDQSLASRVQSRLALLEIAGRWSEVRAIAEAYLNRDPLDEVLVATAIRADVALGANATAHRRFQALRDALAREFGATPGAVVREAMAQLTRANVQAAPPPSDGSPDDEDGEKAPPPRVVALDDRHGRLGGGRPTIAVLAFEHSRDHQEQVYLAQGIAEDIANALPKFKWLFVLSPSSSLRYAGADKDLQQIRRDLGVRYIVQGKLLSMGQRLRVSVSLSDCVLGDTIWSHRFDGPMTDIFTIQDQTIATVIGALEPALFRREEETVTQSEPRSLEHWDLFIRGRWHFWQLSYRNVAAAQALLARAQALKPDDPQTLSLLAFTHIVQLWSAWTDNDDDTLDTARSLAMRAVRTGPDDAFARYTLGAALTLTGDLDRAIAELKQALEINPNFAGAMGELGRYYAFSRLYDDALECFERAIRTSPNDTQLFLWLRHRAVAAFTVRRLDDAVAFAKEAVASRSDVSFNHYLLAATFAASGDLPRGREAFVEAHRLLPKYSMRTMRFSNPFAKPEDLEFYVDSLMLCGWSG